MFKIAIVQKKSNEDIASNTKMAIQRIHEAKDKGADVILFPECFLSGYTFPIKKESILTKDSIYLKSISDTAKELAIGVVITAFTKGMEAPRNTAFFIDRKGSIILQYDKVHTCDFADEVVLEHGDSFKVCEFDGIHFGIMICYDREYPESARVLMLKGAEIILVPNDCCSMKPRIQALSTRAYENKTCVVMANTPGKNAGCSCAYSPICWDKEGNCVDNTIALAGEEETMIIAEFDIEQVRAYRESEMMGNTYRKCHAYQALIK